ncbi:MAG TPA: hypothetical protein VGL77_10335, partial [Armatimonadota bacterium]
MRRTRGKSWFFRTPPGESGWRDGAPATLRTLGNESLVTLAENAYNPYSRGMLPSWRSDEMWKMLRVLLPALSMLYVAACWAAPDPTIVYGLVKGTVAYDGAGPVRNVPVTVVATAGEPLTLTTDNTGTFTGMVPVGRATALAEGNTVTFDVKAGQVNSVSLLIVPARGILIKALNADNTPYVNSFLTGATREANGAPRFLNARSLGNGRYWFPDVSGSVTEFAVSASIPGTYFSGIYFQHWSFPEFAELRKLGIIVPKAVHVTLPITDETGVRLSGLALQGRLSSISPDPFSFWANTPREPTWRDADLQWIVKPTLATDGDGCLDLGNLAPQRYALSLASADADGDFVPFEVKSDGTVTLQAYALHP